MRLYRDGINQNWKGKIIKIRNILSQLSDKYIDEEGSKIEKRFVIIFNFS